MKQSNILIGFALGLFAAVMLTEYLKSKSKETIKS
jgi:hypothetical protein